LVNLFQKQPRSHSLFSQKVTPADRKCFIPKCCHIHTPDQGRSIYCTRAQTGTQKDFFEVGGDGIKSSGAV